MEIDNYLATHNLQNDFKIDKSSLDEKRLKKATDEFEALLVKQMLDISLKHNDPLFGKDAANKIYNSMYNQTMSEALSGGFGFSKILFDFLKENIKD